MPKQEPKYLSDKEIDDWYKSIQAAPAASAPGGAPTGDTPDRYQGILAPGPMEGLQRGFAKEAASLGVNAARLGNRGIGLLSPGLRTSLSDLAERVPGVKRLEAFADEPSQDWGETAGGIGFDLAGGAGLGELGVGSGIARGASRIAPTARYVRGMGFMPTRWGKVAGAASTAGEAAAKGAIGGAITNPDDPVRGAEVGAVAGAAVPGTSRALRSKYGQSVGGFASRGAVSAALTTLGHAFGVPPHILGIMGIAPFVHHWHGLGRGLHRFGQQAASAAGKGVGRIPATAAGMAGSRAEQELEN
jgi:hypothetical protein